MQQSEFMVRFNKVKLLFLFLFAPLVAQALNHPYCMAIYPDEIDTGISDAKNDTALQSTKTNRLWVNFGFGPGTMDIAGVVSVSYQFSGSNLLSLRSAVNGELFGDEIWDIGLLYGLATSAHEYHASFSVGVGVIGGSRSEGLFSPNEQITPQFGIPIEGQLFWRPFRVFGLGLTGFANINFEQSFAGLAFNVQFGRLR